MSDLEKIELLPVNGSARDGSDFERRFRSFQQKVTDDFYSLLEGSDLNKNQKEQRVASLCSAVWNQLEQKINLGVKR